MEVAFFQLLSVASQELPLLPTEETFQKASSHQSGFRRWPQNCPRSFFCIVSQELPQQLSTIASSENGLESEWFLQSGTWDDMSTTPQFVAPIMLQSLIITITITRFVQSICSNLLRQFNVGSFGNFFPDQFFRIATCTGKHRRNACAADVPGWHWQR